MKQLIISEKVQKELLTDFMIMGETMGLIGGYCEDEFPVYYANEEMPLMLGYDAVEEQNMLSQATIDNIPGGYHRCSLEEGHPFLYISDRFLAILGWTREEIKTIFDNKFDNMLHPDDRNLSAKYTARILDTWGHGFTQDQIYRVLGKDGYHWVTDATTLVKSGNQTFFQGNITDITDFVKDKEKKRKNWKTATRS